MSPLTGGWRGPWRERPPRGVGPPPAGMQGRAGRGSVARQRPLRPAKPAPRQLAVLGAQQRLAPARPIARSARDHHRDGSPDLAGVEVRGGEGGRLAPRRRRKSATISGATERRRHHRVSWLQQSRYCNSACSPSTITEAGHHRQSTRLSSGWPAVRARRGKRTPSRACERSRARRTPQVNGFSASPRCRLRERARAAASAFVVPASDPRRNGLSCVKHFTHNRLRAV